MHRPSSLLLREPDRFHGRRVLLAGAPPDELARTLSATDVRVWSWHADEAAWFRAGGMECHFGATPLPITVDDTVLFMPRARARLDCVLSQLAVCRTAATRVWLVGEKRSGVDAAAKRQPPGPDGERPLLHDRARHCALWELFPVLESPLPIEAYDHTYRVDGLTVHALPGVFSRDGLDPGTALLRAALAETALPPGPVLDFGCGAGVLGASVLQRDPERPLVAVDNDAFALASTEQTLAANSLRGTVMASDGLSAVDGRFGTIVTNPPFHHGARKDLSVTERFLRDAVARLEPDGELWLVANRFLPYPALLEAVFGGFERRRETGKFTVYRAVHRA